MDGGKIVVLISSDGERFELPESVEKLSQMVVDKMNEDGYHASNGISLPNIPSDVLAKVIEYCTKHADAEASSDDAAAAAENGRVEELKNFDDMFIQVDMTMLYGLIAADIIKGRTVEQIRHTFGIPPPEEGDEQLDDDPWYF